jgi:hypothetical protein
MTAMIVTGSLRRAEVTAVLRLVELRPVRRRVWRPVDGVVDGLVDGLVDDRVDHVIGDLVGGGRRRRRA